MAKRHGMSAEQSTALSTSFATMTLDGDATGDAAATGVPEACVLEALLVTLDTIAGGLTSLTWFLSADAAGDVPLTLSATTTVTVGKTTATDGGIAVALGVAYRALSVGTANKVYLQIKGNAGTANAIARLIWSTGN